MKAQWFLVKGRFYKDGRDRFGDHISTRVLVIEGRVAVMEEKLPGVDVGDVWESASRWFSDMRVEVEALEAPAETKR